MSKRSVHQIHILNDGWILRRSFPRHCSLSELERRHAKAEQECAQPPGRQGSRTHSKMFSRHTLPATLLEFVLCAKGQYFPSPLQVWRQLVFCVNTVFPLSSSCWTGAQHCVITQQFSTGNKAHRIPQKFYRLSRRNRPIWMFCFSPFSNNWRMSLFMGEHTDGCRPRYEPNMIQTPRLCFMLCFGRGQTKGLCCLTAVMIHQRKLLAFGCACWNSWWTKPASPPPSLWPVRFSV